MVLVSALMPSYNHARYLPQSIGSVLNQTVKDLELIIVDDGSKDNSRAVIEGFQRKDSRVSAYFHEKNMGIAKTVNELLDKATGEYIAHLASDDVWVPSKLEKQLKILSINNQLIVWSEGEIIDGNGKSLNKKFTDLARASHKKKSGRIFYELLNGNYIFGSTLMFKREAMNGIYYDTKLKYLNDFIAMLDLAKKNSFYFIEEPLGKYRVHSSNSVGQDKRMWVQDRWLLSQEVLEKFGEVLPKKTKAGHTLNLAAYFSLQRRYGLAYYNFFQALSLSPSFNTVKSFFSSEAENLLLPRKESKAKASTR